MGQLICGTTPWDNHDERQADRHQPGWRPGSSAVQCGACGRSSLHKGAGYSASLQLDGFYVGANVGGGFSSETASSPLGAFSTNPSGVLGGAQLGYNFLFSANWLLGLEGDFAWTSAQGNVVIPNVVAAATITSIPNGTGPWMAGLVWSRALGCTM